jgi:CRISPR/Cas system endoribonuclease Cas6 (RAMP superfamily)
MGGREHTEVRALTPRKKYVLLPFTLSLLYSLLYSLYNTITGRRKKSMRQPSNMLEVFGPP